MRLIDADALSSRVTICSDWFSDGFDGEDLETMLTMIDNSTTIESPFLTHAEWVTNTDDFTPAKRCTNCFYNKPIVAGEGVTQQPEDFCPSCGAKMYLK